MSQEKAPPLFTAKEFRSDEELHRTVDSLIRRVEKSQGAPIDIPAAQFIRVDDEAVVENKVDEVLGITAEQLAKSIEAKNKREAALAKARREREKKRKAKELLAKKRLAALKKARAARKKKAKADKRKIKTKSAAKSKKKK